ncbi:hypothetical protein Pcinc_008004 [Petrolisthes cinctipes]|uniref:Glucosylceramidase n=1 Tax=Petrolisthes cinctipes TaxID=88211 RepID=A0AAE1G9S7_PETCI|nr:hypothetical protein Pcinc_008004 [Petrolisthes cinctipes]
MADITRLVVVVVMVLGLAAACLASAGCKSKDYGHGSVVCVCDVGHCDRLSLPALPPPGLALMVTSSKAGQRWNSSTARFKAPTDTRWNDVEVEVDASTTYQSILGFGGAFTDAAGLNILTLPDELQEEVLRAYYSPEGLEYNLGRVPIGGTDFSTHPYTYDDLSERERGDPALHHFSLTKEDMEYKIPIIERAMKLAHPTPIKLFGSAWGAPAWMKDNANITGKGKIKPEHYSTWAKYHVRFIESYGEHNLSFWGLTTQNEPTDGLTEGFQFNAVGWTAQEQALWVGRFLGPNLHDANLDHLHLMILDDNRFFLPAWADQVMSDSVAAQYISGVAVHWYTDWVTPTFTLDLTHSRHPSLFLLYTEACTGQWPWQPLKVVLGSWVRAEEYAADIIEALQHWVTGWTDWNLALDMKGGPNWIKNFVDAPIIINAPQGEFYKQPMYYTLAHFTKFLPEGSLRIGLTTKERNKEAENLVLTGNKRKKQLSERRMNEVTSLDDILTQFWTGTTANRQIKEVYKIERTISENYTGRAKKKKRIRDKKRLDEQSSQHYGLSHVAFLRPDNSTVVIFLNKGHDVVQVGVNDKMFGQLSLQLDPHTITTLTWRSSDITLEGGDVNQRS